MRLMRTATCGVVALLMLASPVHADVGAPPSIPLSMHALRAVRPPAMESCGEVAPSAAGAPSFAAAALEMRFADGQPLHAAAVEHSAAYQKRAKIHKIASYATLPLFAAEVVLGQSLYNSTSLGNGLRSAHIAVGTGIIGLFGVNTITGAWNLFGEGRQDTDGRTLRLVHGLLMMASDAGFVATSATGPHRHHQGTFTFATDPRMHRDIALTSIAVGTAGYLVMFIGSHF